MDSWLTGVKGFIMIVNGLYARWHDYYLIEAHSDNPRYVWGLNRTYHEKTLSGAIKALHELINDNENEWDITITYMY